MPCIYIYIYISVYCIYLSISLSIYLSIYLSIKGLMDSFVDCTWGPLRGRWRGAGTRLSNKTGAHCCLRMNTTPKHVQIRARSYTVSPLQSRHSRQKKYEHPAIMRKPWLISGFKPHTCTPNRPRQSWSFAQIRDARADAVGNVLHVYKT